MDTPNLEPPPMNHRNEPTQWERCGSRGTRVRHDGARMQRRRLPLSSFCTNLVQTFEGGTLTLNLIEHEPSSSTFTIGCTWNGRFRSSLALEPLFRVLDRLTMARPSHQGLQARRRAPPSARGESCRRPVAPRRSSTCTPSRGNPRTGWGNFLPPGSVKCTLVLWLGRRRG